ncbi:MAG: hypothetical protein ACK56I_28425, partial [bacterium]
MSLSVPAALPVRSYPHPFSRAFQIGSRLLRRLTWGSCASHPVTTAHTPPITSQLPDFTGDLLRIGAF